MITGVEAEHSENLVGTVTLLATRQGAQVLFSGDGSTFHAISALGDDGVRVTAALTTTAGAVLLDGNADDITAGDSDNLLSFTDPISVVAATVLTLESTASLLAPAGYLTIKAGSGVLLEDNLLAETKGKGLVINADFDSAGDGTFTVLTSKVITSNDSSMVITAWDIDLGGSLVAGLAATNSTISVHGSKIDQTLGLGGTLSTDMQISDDELGRVSAEAGVTLGSSNTGSITVDGITDENSDFIGTLTLIATKAGMQVRFNDTESAFNKGIVVQAMGGVQIVENVASKLTQSAISAGTGTLTVFSTKFLSSTGQLLTVTADDLDIHGQVCTGLASTVIECTSAGQTIGIGETAAQLSINGSELQYFTSTGLSVGGGGHRPPWLAADS